MKSKLKKIIARQSPFYTQHSERAFLRRLKQKSKNIRLKNYPLLACVPTDAIGQHIVFQGLYEEELLLCLFEKIFSKHDLQRFKQQQIIDAGANIGNHTLFFARFFKQVIAFEPNPTALKLLDTNIFLNKANNVHVMPIGLSHQAAVLPFVEDVENLGGSKFHSCNPSSCKTPIQHLRVDKGDVLLQERQTTPIALIKLDIEGHELLALQGLEKTINQHQPIILFETHTSEGEQGSKNIFRYLSKLHYTYFYSIEPIKPHPLFFVRFLEKLKGRTIVLEQISQPEDRYYSTIIATVNPLQ